MKTIAEVKQHLYNLLKEANVSISGKIYKDERPSGSVHEDIVINSLSITSDYLQNGVFNVNCYIPKLEIHANNITQLFSNQKRQQEISKQVLNALHDKWNDDYIVETEYHQILSEEAWDYINIRVQVTVI